MATAIADHYDAPISIAVIGGTGLQTLPNFTHVATLRLDTPWGPPSSPIAVLHHPSASSPAGQPTPIAFLSRHGAHHSLAPHEVPSRANLAALRHLGVRCVLAFSAVGSLKEEIRPRDFVVPDQIIDRTKGIRPATFFEGGIVAHAGFADPFDLALGRVVRGCMRGDGGGQEGCLQGEGVRLHEKGTVVCMEGPAFSTRAESNMYRAWGGSVINMSALPEAKLAREAEMAYQMVCMSTDYDCWRTSDEGGDGGDVSVEMVMAAMAANSANARRVVAAVLDELSKPAHADLVRARHLESSMKLAGAMTHPDGRGALARERLGWLFPGYFS